MPWRIPARARHAAFALLFIASATVLPNRANAQAPPYIGEWYLPATIFPLSGPYGLAISDDDKLYVVDQTNDLVLVYSLAGALLNQWSTPSDAMGLALAQTGEVCVVAAGAVHVYTNSGSFVRTFGSGLYRDIGITPEGDLIVTEPGAHALQKFTLDGTHLGSLGVGLVYEPIDVVVGPDGTLYVTDEGAGLNCVWKLSSSGAMLAKWGGPGAALGEFNGPAGICLSSSQGLFVGDHNNGRVQRLSLAGTFIAAWSYAAPGQLMGIPLDVAVDRFGQLYVADPLYGRIVVYGESPVPTSRITWGSLKARYR